MDFGSLLLRYIVASGLIYLFFGTVRSAIFFNDNKSVKILTERLLHNGTSPSTLWFWYLITWAVLTLTWGTLFWNKIKEVQ